MIGTMTNREYAIEQHLTPTEFKIFDLLENSETFVEIEEIFYKVWGRNRLFTMKSGDGLVKWHISHMRAKLGKMAITSRFGFGYRLEKEYVA